MLHENIWEILFGIKCIVIVCNTIQIFNHTIKYYSFERVNSSHKCSVCEKTILWNVKIHVLFGDSKYSLDVLRKLKKIRLTKKNNLYSQHMLQINLLLWKNIYLLDIVSCKILSLYKAYFQFMKIHMLTLINLFLYIGGKEQYKVLLLKLVIETKPMYYIEVTLR